MTRRKTVCSKWTLVLLVALFCPFVYPRPQDTSSMDTSTSSVQTNVSTENSIRNTSLQISEEVKKIKESQESGQLRSSTLTPNASRDVKTKVPIRESIQLVANQLLDKPNNSSLETTIVADIRIPPKVKTQVSHKHKIKTRNEDGSEPQENAHAGVAVPVTMEDLEAENKIGDVTNESSTSNEGISTWILLSNPLNTDNSTPSTEPTKIEMTTQKKQKQSMPKNKVKRPLNNKNPAKRPIIGSTNKSDPVAGGSAINENVYNKIKDTVLTNVQKNKNTSTQRTTTVKSTTSIPSTETLTTKKEVTKTSSTTATVSKVTTKTKKKNKNKQKVSTTEAPVVNESAMLPMEPKEQEIELEVSTPPVTTKKPKRSTTRKKNKTKKRKTPKPKPEEETGVTEIKTSNKTKAAKPAKKPIIPTGAITTQIYNYFSREVMPSVGVGVIGLASLVGIASYFLYPFSTPVRRTLEVDKKDDLYRNNAEEYANDGNGQAEEEMLGTVLAGMPTHAKHKLNPYAGQTAHVNRYPVKKEQDIRYRNVATKYEPKYNVRYPQQKTGIAHAAVYTRPINYSPQYVQHAYTTEGKYNYDKMPSSYSPYPSVEPIYAAPQTGPSGVSSYGSDTPSSVVYGVKPSSESDFKPVYPFEGQLYSETTNSPITYPPTSMYLGSNNDSEAPEDKYVKNSSDGNEADDNKFVVGNVPKELVDTATPAVVPEHGPRTLSRRKRSTVTKRSISDSLEEILRQEKESNKDIFISNEIDDAYPVPLRNLAPITETMTIISDVTTPTKSKEIIPVYAVSVDPNEDKATTDEPATVKTEIIESVSTLPINNNGEEKSTTESEVTNELDVTTKIFRVYEVFSGHSDVSESSPLVNDVTSNVETTTQFKSMVTETTTEFKSETTSTMPPSPSPLAETIPSTLKPTTTNNPEVITYPPLNQSGGFFSFLKRLVEFKYKLGLSILQTTSDSLNRYLRGMENTVQKVAEASHK